MTDTKIDRAHWSAPSKQSYAYHHVSTSYEDIHYECAKCRSAAVFSAAEQKRSFEVLKNYIWQRRKLCPACNAELFRLRAQERACQERWSAQRKVVAQDAGFMRDWLGILVAIPQFAPRYRNAMQQRLIKLLQRLESSEMDL